MVLRATSLGLGTCWIGAFDQEELARYLALPQDVFIVVLLALGHPDQDPKARPRLALEEILLAPPPRAS